MSKTNPEWMYKMWEGIIGKENQEGVADIRRKVDEYKRNQFTMEEEVLDIVCDKIPFEYPAENVGIIEEFFMKESAKLNSPKAYQREVCIRFLRELMKAGFDIVEKTKNRNLKGWLNKKENKWYVKWSDLHSFGHGDHWMYTELREDQQSIQTLSEDAEGEIELLTHGYTEDGSVNFKYATIKTNI